MRQLLAFLRPSRGGLAAGLLCLTVAAALESVGFSLFVPLIVGAVGAGPASPEPGGAGPFASYVLFLKRLSGPHGIGLVVAALFLALVLKNVFGYTGRLLGAHVEFRTVSTLRTRMLQAYLGLGHQVFLDRKHGRLVHDLFNETALVGEMVTICTVLLSTLLTIAALYFLLLLISWQATLVASTTFVLLTIGLQRLSRLAKRGGALRQQLVREFVGFTADLLLGIRQIKVFGAEPLFAARFRTSAQELSRVNVRVRAISLSVEPLSELVVLLVMVGLVLIATRGLSGALAARVSVLVISAVVLVRLLPLVGVLNRELIRLKAHMKSLEAVAEWLARAPAREECAHGRAFTGLREAIVFDGVEFSYPGAPHAPVLRQITLSVPQGRVTAIVGPSGSGKSTMVDLVACLYEPTGGRVMVDGADLREYDLASWRRAIGFVSQDTFMFNASIRENIALANPGAGDAEIRWAAQQADAHEFIERLPHGYQSVVGERGLKLSGGERQRIAIARAILHRPEILIFDEATSALDRASERRVQEAIARISRDRTVIVVAHRLSTISGADTIVVLDRGRMVERGTHEELMARRGMYWGLYRADEVEQTVDEQPGGTPLRPAVPVASAG